MNKTFEFDYFLLLAKKLLSNKNLFEDSNCQGVYRTVINRAYYAAYHHAKLFLEINHNFKTREFNEETGKMENKDGLSEHVLVFKGLKEISKKEKKLKPQFYSQASRLQNLFKLRKDADYEENVIFKEKQAKDSIEVASSIINFLKFN